MNKSLLPPNSTKLQRVLEELMQPILQIPVDIISTIWNAKTCPEAMLPWLADSLHVDAWDENWSVDMKRAVIAASMDIHRHKGTVGAVKRFLQAAGYGDALIVEGSSDAYYDGTYTYNGEKSYGDPTEWAKYQITMLEPVPNTRITALKKALEVIAPGRCELTRVNYVGANAYDGAITYNGEHNYGAG